MPRIEPRLYPTWIKIYILVHAKNSSKALPNPSLEEGGQAVTRCV